MNSQAKKKQKKNDDTSKKKSMEVENDVFTKKINNGRAVISFVMCYGIIDKLIQATVYCKNERKHYEKKLANERKHMMGRNLVTV